VTDSQTAITIISDIKTKRILGALIRHIKARLFVRFKFAQRNSFIGNETVLTYSKDIFVLTQFRMSINSTNMSSIIITYFDIALRYDYREQ